MTTLPAAFTHHPRPRIAVSACLLGQMVRYDGQHKRDDFVAGRLAAYASFLPVCPEVESGMGAPREPVHLCSVDGGIRMLGNESGIDHTGNMQSYSAQRVEELAFEASGAAGAGKLLAGFVLKARSPSCGIERVKIAHAGAPPSRDGVGLFASALRQRLPLLPVEEEGRLQNAMLRRSFCEAVFAYHRLMSVFADGWQPRDLVAFHTREKFLLLSHDETIYRELGRLTADVGGIPAGDFAARYTSLFMQAMNKPARHGLQCNVLEHLAGFLREHLSAGARAGVHAVIGDYRRKATPLIAPLTLLRHYANVYGSSYLLQQTYFEPFPPGLCSYLEFE